MVVYEIQLQLKQSKTKLKQTPHKRNHENVNSLCLFILPGCLLQLTSSVPLHLGLVLHLEGCGWSRAGVWTQQLGPKPQCTLSKQEESNHQQLAPVCRFSEGSCENFWALPAFRLHQSMAKLKAEHVLQFIWPQNLLSFLVDYHSYRNEQLLVISRFDLGEISFNSANLTSTLYMQNRLLGAIV